MNKAFIFLICLLCVTVAQICTAPTQSSCEAKSCIWNNGTCSSTNPCVDGLKYISNSSTCVNCSELPSNNCSQICTQYYFSDTSNMCIFCTNLDSYCLTCNSSYCFTCSDGFATNANHPTQCLISLCSIRHCTFCKDNTTCSNCKDGYIPNDSGTLCSLLSCSITNCKYCTSNSHCVTCKDGYKLSSDRTTCTLICQDTNCLSCSSYSTCITCATGYTYNHVTSHCKLTCSVANCNYCDISTSCTQCASGYSVSATATSCTPICSVSYCKSCTVPQTCTQCTLGYTLKDNVCSKTICLISRCTNCSTSVKCFACDSISTLSSNNELCVQNCLALIKNCNSCLSNDTCNACKPGFTLSNNLKQCNMLCTVSNCGTCLTSSTCLNCKSGYIVSSDYTTCLFNCGIANCDLCNSTTTCQTCKGVYTLADSASSCKLVCSPGFFLNTTSLSCQSCSSQISFCTTCEQATSVICLNCADLYYLTGNGACKLCSDAIANCIFCLNSANCTSCSSGYNLMYSTSNTYVCILPYSCNVLNCKQCLSDNSAACSTCNSGYYLSNSACFLISCLDTQYYDTLTSSCLCPLGTLLRDKKCQYCNIDHCITCNSAGCASCKAKYFPDDGKCISCLTNCKNCTSSTYCVECENGYIFRNSACIISNSGGSTVVENNTTNTTTAVTCPPGCSKCSYNSNSGSVSCTTAKDGYAIDSSGNLVKCSDTCATCASFNSQICTSCVGSTTLIGGQCIQCSDPNALKCPNNNALPTKCSPGYVNSFGSCKQCAANCLICGVAGANKCDDGGCASGYVKIVGTTNCTQCFSSCASCSTNNPSICLSCGGSSFLSNTSTCVSCTSPCLSCSSATVCTSCSYNFILDSNWCYPQIGFPCSSQSKSVCTSCYLGFTLEVGSCLTDTSCNGTKTCSSCDKYYYLKSRQCFPCLSTTNCDYCNPNSPSSCLACSDGYYLRSSTKACVLCSSAMAGCQECISSKYCTTASSGYYLKVDNWGDQTGKVKQCDSSCATCSNEHTCDTCADGYKKVGTSCIYAKNLQAKFTIASAAGSSHWFKTTNTPQENLANAFLNLNQIINAILMAAGFTNPKKLVVTGLSIGSLIVSTTAIPEPTDNFADFSNSFSSNTQKLPGFTVVDKSITVNGETGSSSANSAIILGVTIPLVVLLAVIIIVLKIKLSEGDDKDTSETQKQIEEEFQM